MMPLVRCSGPIQDGARPRPIFPHMRNAVVTWTSARTSAPAVSHTFIANIDGNGRKKSAWPVGGCVLPYTPWAIATTAPTPGGTRKRTGRFTTGELMPGLQELDTQV